MAGRVFAKNPSRSAKVRRRPCSHPCWFVLGGAIEIGLQNGSARVFRPGEHFYSADTLPAGAVFDPKVHGHWSRQLGDDPLVTLFVRG